MRVQHRAAPAICSITPQPRPPPYPLRSIRAYRGEELLSGLRVATQSSTNSLSGTWPPAMTSAWRCRLSPSCTPLESLSVLQSSGTGRLRLQAALEKSTSPSHVRRAPQPRSSPCIPSLRLQSSSGLALLGPYKYQSKMGLELYTHHS